jgi:carbamoyl-phosphate synthase large subunit
MKTDSFNILFTCAGRRVALLDNFRDAMARLGLAGRLFAADASWTAPAYHRADVGLLAPRVDDEGYLAWLCEQVARQEIRLIVPVTDLDLLGLSQNRRRLAELGCTVMISEPQAVAICRDKARTAEAVARAGLAPVRTLSLPEFRDEPFYPCFIKPVDGSASIGAARVDSLAALEAHVGVYGENLIVQEVLAGAEFTLDVYRARGGAVRCVVPRQRLQVRSGEVETGVTVDDAELIDAGRALIESIDGLWGVCCCQCIRPAGQTPRFFEINPRFGGGAPLSIAAGADLPRYLLEEVTGREISATGSFRAKLLMSRYDEAVFREVGRIDDLPGARRPRFR